MAIREYELIVAQRTDATADASKNLIGRLKTTIEQKSGTLLQSIDLGKRTLAYEIEKQTRGQYQYLSFAGEGALVAELERLCRLDESVLRFHTVLIASKIDIATRQAAQDADFKKLQIYFNLAGAPVPPAPTGDMTGDHA